MRIVEDTGNRMVLRGVPHGAPWMVFSAVLGLGVAAVCVAIGAWIVRKGASLEWLALLPLSVGVALGAVFFGFGAVALATREVLELSRVTGRGDYHVRTLLIGERRRLSFSLAEIKGVSLEAYTVKGHGRGSFPRPALRTRLLLEMGKREAVELDDTQNGREARVKEVAARVAGFLGVEVREMSHGPVRRGRKRDRSGAAVEQG